MLPKLVVWGASGHALVVIDIIRQQGQYDIVGLIDDINVDRVGTKYDGLPIIGGFKEFLKLMRDDITHIIIAIGDCNARLSLAKTAKESGLIFANAIHPHAIVANNTKIGCGTVIAAGAVVNPRVNIGDNVIINTSSTVDHECVIANGVHLSPGVHLGGLVTVEEGAWIGIGATIRDRITIGAYSIVGAGSVITKDVPQRTVVFGVPGKVIRSVQN